MENTLEFEIFGGFIPFWVSVLLRFENVPKSSYFLQPLKFIANDFFAIKIYRREETTHAAASFNAPAQAGNDSIRNKNRQNSKSESNIAFNS